MLKFKTYLLISCIALVLVVIGTAYALVRFHSFSVSSSFGDRDVFEFNVTTTGTIRVVAQWISPLPMRTSPRLALILNGPRRPHLPNPDAYYARRDGTSPLVITYNVTEEDLSRRTRWKVSIVNFSRRGRARGTIKITYPPYPTHPPTPRTTRDGYRVFA
jgi:hypothetical protein